MSVITLEALVVLDAIDKRGSYAGAAEQLNKVPSALSYIVQKLEEQLGVTLFVRQGRKSVLTHAGRHLLDEGRKVLEAVNHLEEQTQTLAHGWEPRIRIAVDSIVDFSSLLPSFKTFVDTYPNIELDIGEEVLNGSWEALLSDRVDMVIGAPAPVPVQQGLRAVKILDLEHVLTVKKDHPLASLPSPIEKQDIQAYRTIVVHDSSQFSVTRSSNIIEKSTHCFVNSVEQKIQAIVAGIGVGFLPRSRIEKQIQAGELVALAVREPQSLAEAFMAWKIVNKGKGLNALREILTHYLIK
jgi:DNA-binding transcriptional LysR family regulator